MKTKLLIFGITGDLSTRKLLPAIEQIITDASIKLEVIGVSRSVVNLEELISESTLRQYVRVFTMNIAEPGEYQRLKESIDLKSDEQLLVYLSVPPRAATQIVDFLGETGINTPNVKLLFEKPFGVDLVSAEEIISRTARFYNEDQIFRIDHYLAKEMAQNIVALRGGNALFGHVWNDNSIERIEVLALETLTIEGRGQFYEQTGALRDVVQGHLMQLLALILMEIPLEFDWNELPSARLAALRQLQSANKEKAVRSQYDGYAEEAGNPGSMVETFVSLELLSNDPRWKNTTLALTTGKALNEKTTEIRIHFRKAHEAQSNCLVFHVQPNEGVEIELYIKKPGYDREFEVKKLAFSYPEDTILPDAYEQVLVDAIRSRKSLFTSSEEVLESWRILQPLLDDWVMSNERPKIYKKGSAPREIITK